MRRAIEHAAPDAYALGAHLRAENGRSASEHGLDAREQLAWVERLGYIVVRAHLEPDDTIDHSARGGQHDDRKPAIALAQMTREAQAVLPGHGYVEQRHVDGVLGGQCARGGRAFRTQCGVALRDEILLQNLAQVGFVVDDQDGGLRAHGCLARWLRRGSPQAAVGTAASYRYAALAVLACNTRNKSPRTAKSA